LLCEVAESLAADGWDVVGLRPSGAAPDPDAVAAMLETLLARRMEDSRRLVVVDGLGWSEAWGTLVERIAALAVDGHASVLIAADGYRTTDWRLPVGHTVTAPGTLTGLPAFVDALLDGGYVPEHAGLGESERRQLRSTIIDVARTDLWAVVHLASIIGRPNWEQEAASRLWRDRVASDDGNVGMALAAIAGLSWFGVAAPLDDITRPGLVAALALGAELRDESIRLNSAFLCRALLARRPGASISGVQLDRGLVAERAGEFLTIYVRACLEKPQRHADALRILRDLRLHRTNFEDIVGRLAEGSRPTWDTWEQGASLPIVAATVLVVRSELPPKTLKDLMARLAERVRDGEAAGLPLSSLLDCLAVLRWAGDGRPGVVATARGQLIELTRVALEQGPVPASPEQRQRVVRLVHRFGDAEAVRTLAELAPVLVRPRTRRVVEGDLRFLVSFLSLLRRSGTTEGRRLWDEVAATDEVREVVDRAREARGGARFLAVLAATEHVLGLTGTGESDGAVGRLRRAVASASLQQLQQILSFCNAHYPELARDVGSWLDDGRRWSALYRQATPNTLADWLDTVSRTNPRQSARSLRKRGNAVDMGLVRAQARIIDETSGPSRVGCGKLLAAAARAEDQAGCLDDGFAMQLATQLGTGYLSRQIQAEHRITVVVHLIEGFLDARADLDDDVRRIAVEIIEHHVRASRSERGPALALALASSTTGGQGFLAGLAARPRLSRPVMLEAMQRAVKPAAVAAFHRLAVLLHPGVEREYREWLDEADLRQRTFVRDLGDGADPLDVLRAAVAIANTLLLTGDREAGSQLLGLMDQFGRGDWPQCLWNLDDRSLLPEGLSLLYKLDPERARAFIRTSRATEVLLRRLRPSEHGADPFTALMRTVATIDAATAETLVDRLRDEGSIDVVVGQIAGETNTFTQVELVHRLQTTAGRTGGPLIPDATFEALVDDWRTHVPTISNPRVLARLVESVAFFDVGTAHSVVARIGFPLLRSRFSRRLRRESADVVHLASVLFDLTPSYAADLLDEQTLSWLLGNASVTRLPEIVEVAIRSVFTVDVETAVADRLATLVHTASHENDLRDVWLAAGAMAWVLDRFGRGMLALPEPQHIELLAALPATDILRATAWLAPASWRDSLVEAAVERLTADGPPADPDECAVLLAVRLRWGLPRDGEDEEMELWRRALDAPIVSLRLLTKALQESISLDSPLEVELAALRKRLVSRGAAWRRIYREVVEAIPTRSAAIAP
jgi:hypothetical protein